MPDPAHSGSGWGYVRVDPPSDGGLAPSVRAARYRVLIESLIGGLEYPGVVKWLAMYDTLDDAFEAAERLRDGQVAT